MRPHRGSSISAPKHAKNNAHPYLPEFYLLYKSRFGVFMLILYTIYFYFIDQQEKQRKRFSFTAHSIIQGLRRNLNNKINPLFIISVVSMFHHVSSTSKGFVQKHWNLPPTYQLPGHIILKDSLCLPQYLLLHSFLFRCFFFWKVLQFMAFQVQRALKKQ